MTLRRPPFSAIAKPFEPYGEGPTPPVVYAQDPNTGQWDYYPIDQLPSLRDPALRAAPEPVTWKEAFFRLEETLGQLLIMFLAAAGLITFLFGVACLFTLIG